MSKAQAEGKHAQTEEKKKQSSPENPEDELKFIIAKTNRANVKKSRVLCLRTRTLLGYGAKGGKTTLLNLADINLVERSLVDKKRVTLNFTNRPRQIINFPDSALREKFLGRLVKLWLVASEEKSRVPHSMIDHKNIKICAMTWNVGGSSPPANDILQLILGDPGLHDLYIFNFQEASKKKEDWCLAFKAYCEHTGVTFTVITTSKLWDMVQMVLAKEALCKFITHVESDTVACGVGDVIGNKGGIGTSFNVFDTSLCAVNCHLAARAERLQQRQANYTRIVSSLQLGMKSCDLVNQFNHVIWAGDLNYRVHGEFQQAVADVKEGKFDRLSVADQLASEMQNFRVLAGFKEGPLDFAPTYRWDRHTPEVSNKREQIPSWTDRVLWKSAQPSALEFKTYKGFPEAYGSDHRPVVATFVLHPHLPYDGMEVVSSSATVRDRKHLEVGITFPRVHMDIPVESEIQATFTSSILESAVNPPPFASTEREGGMWEGTPIKLIPFVFNKEEIKAAHITVTFTAATDEEEARETRADIEKGRALVLGYALVPLERIFLDNSGFNVLITKGGQVVGQFSGKFNSIHRGTIDFEMEVPPPLATPKEKTGLLSLFGKGSKSEPSDGVEVNNETPASELAYVTFPFRSIVDKWLFHVEEYVVPSKDRGPASGLHGALCCLKDLFLLGGGSWAKKLPIEVGLIKGTGDCGNASLGMGLASVFFKRKKDANAVGLVNCGTGGTRLQLYVRTQGVISLMQEYKLPGGGKGVFSNLRVGMYVPNKENSSDQIKEEIKVLLASAPWANPKMREKLAKLFKIKLDKLVIPVFGFVRGTIRNYWETCLTSNAHESELCEALVNHMMGSILGQGSNLTTILGEKTGYLLKQSVEGQMELAGCRTLYAQYSAATNHKLEPVITLGVSRGSTQWSSVDLITPEDYRKYSVGALQLGMESPMFAEQLAAAVTALYPSTDGLVKLMQSVVDRGNCPVIALKSGCLLNLSDGTGGRKRRKMLTEVVHAYYYNMMPVKVTLARWTGESVEHEICSSSVAAVCAEASELLAQPEEYPRPQFVKVSLEGKSSFLTDLVDLPENSVLVFATAQQLISNPFLLLSEAAPRFAKDDVKKEANTNTKRPLQLNTSSPYSTPSSSAPNTPSNQSSNFKGFVTTTPTSSAPPTPVTAARTLASIAMPSSKRSSIQIAANPSATALLLAQALLEEAEESGGDSSSTRPTPAPIISVTPDPTTAATPAVNAQAQDKAEDEKKVAELARYRALFASPGFDMGKLYVQVLFDDEGSDEDGELPLVEHEFLEVKNQAAEWWLGVKVSDRTAEGLFPSNFVKVLDLPSIKALLAATSGPPPVRNNTPSLSSDPLPTLAVSPSASLPATPLTEEKNSAPSASTTEPQENAPPPPPVSKRDESSDATSPVVPSTPPVSPLAAGANSESDKPKAPLAAGECNLKAIAIHPCDAATKSTGSTYLSFAKGDQLTILKKKSERWWWAVNSKGAKGWIPANHVQVIE